MPQKSRIQRGKGQCCPCVPIKHTQCLFFVLQWHWRTTRTLRDHNEPKLLARPWLCLITRPVWHSAREGCSAPTAFPHPTASPRATPPCQEPSLGQEPLLASVPGPPSWQSCSPSPVLARPLERGSACQFELPETRNMNEQQSTNQQHLQVP